MCSIKEVNTIISTLQVCQYFLAFWLYVFTILLKQFIFHNEIYFFKSKLKKIPASGIRLFSI